MDTLAHEAVGSRSGAPATGPAQSTAALSLLALGVVYGDIGTSPLYAVKETFSAAHGIALNEANILGGLSTIFWTLTIVVSLKYVVLVLRADNRGEGGIMALLALTLESVRDKPRLAAALSGIGLVGAALFYGDAVLTPAISVLSAIEGLEVGTAAFKPYVVPISAGILVGLFLIQRHGTAVVGASFGPVCILWFIAIAAAGVWNIAKVPAVLGALNPLHALRFVTGHGLGSVLALGAVLLVITGAEALYADMGHFGKRAVRTAWFGLVAPALVLNYFGQGALLFANPQAIENPFFLAFPSWALYPMVALATAATVVASQATISGAYSMTQQAIHLGFLPRMTIHHTSARAIGQIYVPAVNWLLLGAVTLAVIGFGSSTKLASAYGVAVMGTMLTTTLLTFFVIRDGWGFPLWLCIAATGVFLLVDAMFLGAALLKVVDGGWFPLIAGGAIFAVMSTWRRGRQLLAERVAQYATRLEPFLKSLFDHAPQRVSGTAVFLTPSADAVPSALLHSLKHYKVLHERVIFLTVQFTSEPRVVGDRVLCSALGHECHRVIVRYGFMDRPHIEESLELCRAYGLEVDMMDTSFFLSRETIVPGAGTGGEGMAHWRDRLFAAMTRNAGRFTDYFRIPGNRVVELGSRVEI
jgi:KUP system potassium uptake protein